jgi:hypothetical protein
LLIITVTFNAIDAGLLGSSPLFNAFGMSFAFGQIEQHALVHSALELRTASLELVASAVSETKSESSFD